MTALEAKHIKKAFGETKALKDCSFQCSEGEIHAIIGENGSGKSTLVKILSGIITPDSGEVLVRNEKVHLRSLGIARNLGIISITQEILAVPALSVLENVYLGQGRLFSGPAPREFQREVEKLFRILSSEPIDLAAPLEELPLSKQQIVVITRALVLDPYVAILDESTSALDVGDRDRLFDYLRHQRSQGKSSVYISHRIDEIQGLADRLTVIRSGNSIETVDAKNAPVSTILRLMSGEDRVKNDDSVAVARTVSGQASEAILEASNVVINGYKGPINYTVNKGEIVGLAGLEGQGQEIFLEILGGLNPLGLKGDIYTYRDSGEKVSVHTLQKAFQEGIAYVPKDRKTEGLFLKLSIKDNFGMPSYGLVINQRQISHELTSFKEKLSIVFDDENKPVGSLSGGTQQKVVLARWLETHPRVLLLNDPTRGVDIPTKHDIYHLFRELTSQNVSVVLVSTDLEELISICDRIAVFRDGEIFADFQDLNIRRDNVIAAMFGEEIWQNQ